MNQDTVVEGLAVHCGQLWHIVEQIYISGLFILLQQLLILHRYNSKMYDHSMNNKSMTHLSAGNFPYG